MIGAVDEYRSDLAGKGVADRSSPELPEDCWLSAEIDLEMETSQDTLIIQ